MIMAAQWDRIDWSYLERRTMEEGTLDKMQYIRRVVEEIISS